MNDEQIAQVTALANLLFETAHRHGVFEENADEHNWWDWYAAFMQARQGGQRPDEASTSADRYMAEVKNISAGS